MKAARQIHAKQYQLGAITYLSFEMILLKNDRWKSFLHINPFDLPSTSTLYLQLTKSLVQTFKMLPPYPPLSVLLRTTLLILPLVSPAAAVDSSKLCSSNLIYSPFIPWFKAWPNVTSGPNIGANVDNSSSSQYFPIQSFRGSEVDFLLTLIS